MSDGSDGPQLILIISVDADGTSLRALDKTLDAVRVACLIVVPRPEVPLALSAIKPLVAAAQARGIAALVADDSERAHQAGADGVHLTYADGDVVARYRAARAIIGDGQIVGVDAGQSRDVAMRAGEAGADYVAFRATSPAADQFALVEWWSSIFEVPVVALDVEEPWHARDLADAGADFIAVQLATATAAGGLAAFAAAARTVQHDARPEEVAS